MLDSTIKYSSHIFINDDEILGTPENFSKLLNEFKDNGFIPTTIQEVDQATGTPTPKIQLSSPESGYSIACLSKKIVIERNPVNIISGNILDQSEFCNDTINFYSRVHSIFKPFVKRMSYVTEYFFRDMSENGFSFVYNKMFSGPSLYKNKDVYEWVWRSTAWDEIEIQEKNEKLNVIVDMTRLSGYITSGANSVNFDKIRLLVDLNTSQKNLEPRFSESDVICFYEKIKDRQSRIINQLDGYLYG
jgi:hypothetical protein